MADEKYELGKAIVTQNDVEAMQVTLHRVFATLRSIPGNSQAMTQWTRTDAALHALAYQLANLRSSLERGKTGRGQLIASPKNLLHPSGLGKSSKTSVTQ
jgi:hypothetical protein